MRFYLDCGRASVEHKQRTEFPKRFSMVGVTEQHLRILVFATDRGCNSSEMYTANDNRLPTAGRIRRPANQVCYKNDECGRSWS